MSLASCSPCTFSASPLGNIIVLGLCDFMKQVLWHPPLLHRDSGEPSATVRRSRAAPGPSQIRRQASQKSVSTVGEVTEGGWYAGDSFSPFPPPRRPQPGAHTRSESPACTPQARVSPSSLMKPGRGNDAQLCQRTRPRRGRAALGLGGERISQRPRGRAHLRHF